ncbi:MAG TPA: Smr/MutS family protein [Alphaproteobacteria bacterium]|nr:Smr/MutS family protein [Alphaproteobacteria bacterium]
MPRPRPDRVTLSEAELRLWRHVMRDAKPLDRPAATARTSTRPPVAPRASVTAPVPVSPSEGRALPRLPPAAAPSVGLGGEELNGLDARTAGRLRRGRLPIQGRLDLHGHTQAEAHKALIAFVESSYRRGDRCLLVITGKGQGSAGGKSQSGVLRAAVPRWLAAEPLRGRILAVTEARPQHGGGGAFYLLLRRERKRPAD